MQRVLFPPRSAFSTGVAVALAFTMLRAEAVAQADAVRRADELMASAVATKDVPSLRRMLLTEVRFLGTGDLVKGPDAVVRAWAEYLDPRSKNSLLRQPEAVTVAQSEDLAFSIGAFQVVETTDEGEEEVHGEGRYVTIWRFKQGQWRVVADSPLLPLDEDKLELQVQSERRPPRVILQGPNATAVRAIRLHPSADGTLAYAVGEYRAPSGTKGSGARHGVFLAVWERQQEGAPWRLTASSFPEPR